jgi:peptidoglycan/xylan/chitin deacetylase (PgdA/CDA1 family)
VFLYHDVREATTRDRYTVTVSSFKQQLTALRECEFSAANLDELADTTAAPRVVFTFDDGLASHYEHAFPALLEFGFCATFFVTTALVEEAGYLTWSQIREMSDAGMTIGSHGFLHTDYSLLAPSVALHQLRSSRQSLEDAIGKPVTSFSAPYGFLSQTLAEIAREAGFDHICSSLPSLANATSAIIPRIAVYSNTSAPKFLALAHGRPAPMLSRLARHTFLYAPKQLLLRTWPQRLGVDVQEVTR